MKVISFEGFEYSGKSTQIKLLKKYFIKNNIKSTFNQWFTDEINDLQPDKPWIAAAHATNFERINF